jgi:hypothetical protein
MPNARGAGHGCLFGGILLVLARLESRRERGGGAVGAMKVDVLLRVRDLDSGFAECLQIAIRRLFRAGSN